MRTTVNGTQFRLRFVHFNFGTTSVVPRRQRRGYTACVIERCVTVGEAAKKSWVPLGKGEAACGAKDNFNKEVGRQFALVRALQNTDVDNKVKAGLLQDYLMSKRKGRELCEDLYARGFVNLFEPVFRPDIGPEFLRGMAEATAAIAAGEHRTLPRLPSSAQPDSVFGEAQLD